MKHSKKLIYSFLAITILVLASLFFPNQESTITTDVTINARNPLVYQTLLQIDKVDDWFSAVLESDYVTDIQDAPGCIRQCKLEDGSIVQEKMIHAVENQLIQMEMIQYNLPLDYFRWDILTESKGVENTRVIQITKYKVKFGLIGVLLNMLVIKKALGSTLDSAYLQLKSHIESDE